MILCNEVEMWSKMPPSDQCTGVIYQEAFGWVLTSVTEFTIDTQIMDNFNPFSFVHGNKHIE